MCEIGIVLPKLSLCILISMNCDKNPAAFKASSVLASSSALASSVYRVVAMYWAESQENFSEFWHITSYTNQT